MKLIIVFIIKLFINSLKLKQEKNERDILKELIRYEQVLKKFSENDINTLKADLDEQYYNSSNTIEYLKTHNGTYEYDMIVKEIANYNENEKNKKKVVVRVLDTLIDTLLNANKTAITKYGKDLLEYTRDFTDDDYKMFIEVGFSQDEDPPKPYTSPDLPCRNPAECKEKKLSWMK
jgi:hypothetical protein